MLFNLSQKLWLPYLVSAIGILLTCFLWFLLRYDIQHYLGIHPVPESYHPVLVLVFGFGFSILIGIMVWTAQIARQRAIFLKEVNENLKKEISERINAEEHRQKLEIDLVQGQKLQAMGTLAGGIAHDFNNILYAIIGYVEMAREDVSHGSLIYKNLGKVLDASHRGQELVSRILTFSRRQHHQLDAISLTNAIEAALGLLRSTIPASVIIHFEHTINPTILGNQTLLHQVFINLINNAVDAMDEEGTIDISLTQVAKNDPLLQQFSQKKDENYCKIEIKDTGHGMDQATIDRIFEPFFTTKEVGKGTGLGLSIVHSIIKEHEGEISVKSQLGHGTMFTILLPEILPA